MASIIYVGMDVHTINYTLCAMRPIISENDRVFAMIKVTPAYKNSLMFIENLKMKLGLNNEYDIQCGYEAGCLDYSLYNQLAVADETSGGTCKGAVGHNGNKAEVIAYADKANMRLRSRYYKRNVAVAAIAREESCGNIYLERKWKMVKIVHYFLLFRQMQ